MADIKLKDPQGVEHTYNGIDTMVVPGATGGQVVFTEGGGGATYTAGVDIDITDNVISQKIPLITLSQSQIIQEDPMIAQMTDEQASLLENNQIAEIDFDVSAIGFGHAIMRREYISTSGNDIRFTYHWDLDDNQVADIIYNKTNKQCTMNIINLQEELTEGYGIDISDNEISAFAPKFTITGEQTEYDDGTMIVTLTEEQANIVWSDVDIFGFGASGVTYYVKKDFVISFSDQHIIYGSLTVTEDRAFVSVTMNEEGTSILTMSPIKDAIPTITLTEDQVISINPVTFQMTSSQDDIIVNEDIDVIRIDADDLGYAPFFVRKSFYDDDRVEFVVQSGWSGGQGADELFTFNFLSYNTSTKQATYKEVEGQKKLTAGSGITIDENNVISATGGGGVSDAVRYGAEQNLTDTQKNQAKKNQGLYYIEPKTQILTWDGNTTGKSSIDTNYNYLYKISDDISWFDPDEEDVEYSIELESINTSIGTWDGTSGTPVSCQISTGDTINLYLVADASELTSWERYVPYLYTTFNDGMTINLNDYSTGNYITGKSGISGDGFYNNNIFFVRAYSDEADMVPGIYSTKWTEDDVNIYVSNVSVKYLLDSDEEKIIKITNNTPWGEEDESYYAVTSLMPGKIRVPSQGLANIGYVPIVISTDEDNPGVYFGYKEASSSYSSDTPGLFTKKLYKQKIHKIEGKNNNTVIANVTAPFSMNIFSGFLCDTPFDEVKEAFLSGKEVLLYNKVLDKTLQYKPLEKIMVYKAIDYVPEIETKLQGYMLNDAYTTYKFEQIRFVGLTYTDYRERSIVGDTDYGVSNLKDQLNSDISGTQGVFAGRVELTSMLLCRGLNYDLEGSEFITPNANTSYEWEDPILKKSSIPVWGGESGNNQFSQTFEKFPNDDGYTYKYLNNVYADEDKNHEKEVNMDIDPDSFAKAYNDYDQLHMVGAQIGDQFGYTRSFDQDLKCTYFKNPSENLKRSYYNPSIDSCTNMYPDSSKEAPFDYQDIYENLESLNLKDSSNIDSDYVFRNYITPDYRQRARINLFQKADCWGEEGHQLQNDAMWSYTLEPGISYQSVQTLQTKELNIARSNLNLPYDIYVNEVIWSGSITDRQHYGNWYFVNSKIYTKAELLERYYTTVTYGDQILGDPLGNTYNGNPKAITSFVDIDNTTLAGFQTNGILIVTDAKSSGLPTGTYFSREASNASGYNGFRCTITRNILRKEPTNLLDTKYTNVPIPTPPTTDGTYTLKVTVSGGVPTYSWVPA